MLCLSPVSLLDLLLLASLPDLPSASRGKKSSLGDISLGPCRFESSLMGEAPKLPKEQPLNGKDSCSIHAKIQLGKSISNSMVWKDGWKDGLKQTVYLQLLLQPSRSLSVWATFIIIPKLSNRHKNLSICLHGHRRTSPWQFLVERQWSLPFPQPLSGPADLWQLSHYTVVVLLQHPCKLTYNRTETHLASTEHFLHDWQYDAKVFIMIMAT